MQEQVYGPDSLGHQPLGQPEDVQHQEFQISVGFRNFKWGILEGTARLSNVVLTDCKLTNSYLGSIKGWE